MARRWRFGTVAVGVLALAGVGTWSAASSSSSSADRAGTARGTTTTEPAFATFVAPRTTAAPTTTTTTTTAPAPTTTATTTTTTTGAPVAADPPDTAKPGRAPVAAADGAAPGTSGAGRRVVMVGDSVMAALSDQYTGAATKIIGGAGWEVVLDAVVNRSALQGETVIGDHLGDATDTVVVMLGHNDGSDANVFRDRAEVILGELDGVPRVFWLTMREPRYAADNEVLGELAAEHPNLHVIDWNGAIQPGWTAGDGLHLNGSGATGMAELILAAITA